MSRFHRTLAVLAGVLWVVVVFSYTMLKTNVALPGVWDSEVHQRRELRLIPLQGFFESQVWWGPLQNMVGNIGLFVPVGFLLVIVFAPRRPVRVATITGCVISLTIEVSQFVFARGYSDVDDLIFNTLGAALGAWIGTRVPTKAVTTSIGLIVAVGLVAIIPFALDGARWLRDAMQ
ncbi:VanZ family protein [Corynebacterium cystitidis]|uniref:VanZ family protein n=1 Tax=Corynebacterium cystitidis TaxID=35757 RepID=UPI00211E95CF|nr:VanZ family protein [Corynebacterium cystitidis]